LALVAPLGLGLVAELPQLLPDGLFLAAQPRGQNAVTAVKAQECASIMPKLPEANTVAGGLLNVCRCVLMIAVHFLARLWLDILALLGSLGFTDTLGMAHGGRSCHGPSRAFLKNLPQ
jgi:hypothetical protein